MSVERIARYDPRNVCAASGRVHLRNGELVVETDDSIFMAVRCGIC
ncbi:MAG TPA: hypothetical protein VJG30_04075 [Candidatus Nanoarchaeia archaeon]|nr:hypothetical protein [Candidatus Nanoarchaeia archaeon]